MTDTLSLSYPRQEYDWYVNEKIRGAESTVAAAAYNLPILLAVLSWWVLTRPLALLWLPVRWLGRRL